MLYEWPPYTHSTHTPAVLGWQNTVGLFIIRILSFTTHRFPPRLPVYFPQSPLDPSEQGKEEKAIRTEWPLSTREDSQTHSVVELRY